MHEHNNSFDRTLTKLVTILTKWFFFRIWTLQATLKYLSRTFVKTLNINFTEK